MSTALQPFRQEAAYLFGLTSIQGNEFTILAKIEIENSGESVYQGADIAMEFQPG